MNHSPALTCYWFIVKEGSVATARPESDVTIPGTPTPRLCDSIQTFLPPYSAFPPHLLPITPCSHPQKLRQILPVNFCLMLSVSVIPHLVPPAPKSIF
jgi:hypothetical protein